MGLFLPRCRTLKWTRIASWRAKEGGAAGAVHQQEMIVASHCKSRNGGY